MEGNQQKMREALEECMEFGKKIDESLGNDESTVWNCRYERSFANSIVEIARAALSAPARNCDMPYNDRVEMYGAFKDWCKANGRTMEPMLAWDAFDWLLASSKKKGDSSDEEQAQDSSL